MLVASQAWMVPGLLDVNARERRGAPERTRVCVSVLVFEQCPQLI